MKTKYKILIGLVALALLLGAAFIAFCFWAASVPDHPVDDELRATLERVYTDYLVAIDREDPKLLTSVLTDERKKEYAEVWRINNLGKFPDDFFKTKHLMPNMPPTTYFQFVAMTKSETHANLIYIGNMKGYLKKTSDDRRFLIIQFKKEDDGWKYLVVVDPPASMVPNVDDRIRNDQLYFLKMKPFKAEEIPLVP